MNTKREQQKIRTKKQEKVRAKKRQQNLNKFKKQQQESEQPKDPQQELQDKINEIREFIGNGNYIYRGENNKNNEKISSKLYRYFQTRIGQAVLQGSNLVFNFDFIKQPLESELEKQLERQFGEGAPKLDFASIEKSLKENVLAQLAQRVKYPLNVESVQKELILKDVQEYVDFEDEIDTWVELQHYGGATNRIDFSYDLAVALFFACDGEPKKDGRLILLRRDAKDIIDPKKNQNNRTVFQKSVFVKRDDGYIDEQEEGQKIRQFEIPQNLKPLLLTYVQNYFGIRTETVYGDLIGYIQNQGRNNEIYKQFFGGLIYYTNGFFAESEYFYTKVIDLKPDFTDAYNGRGNAMMRLTPPKLKEAIDDYNNAIKLNSNYAEAYSNRSVAYNQRGEKGDYDLAITDSNKAIELNPNYAQAYGSRGMAKKALQNFKEAKEDLEKALQLAEQQEKKEFAADVRKELGKLLADSDS